MSEGRQVSNIIEVEGEVVPIYKDEQAYFDSLLESARSAKVSGVPLDFILNTAITGEEQKYLPKLKGDERHRFTLILTHVRSEIATLWNR